MNNNLTNVHPKAKIGRNVTIEPFATIYEDVVIGDNCWIASNSVIMNGARIGNNCKIFPGAIISAESQDLKYNGEPTEIIIGNNSNKDIDIVLLGSKNVYNYRNSSIYI